MQAVEPGFFLWPKRGEKYMVRHAFLSTSLILLLAGMSAFWASCSATPTKSLPPTPTPIPAGSIFFDPLRVSTETKAIEVRVVNCSGRVPAVESAIVITEPATLQAITTTLLSAVSTTPSTDPPAVQQGSGYLVSLYLYSRDDVLPQSGTSGPWLLADVTYNYDVGVIAIHLPDAQDEVKVEFYPIAPVLRDILEHSGALPH
ncbi:MAG: hypothetical protein H5T61_08815 [Thermoflexales bacterium]|nr:hypothetical protein [Thermoflexales bacterium]